jgi:hypothetical protein
MTQKPNIQRSTVSFHVQNAGMVLLHSYFPLLFERFHLMEDSTFKDEKKHYQALFYLQYLVSGSTDIRDEHLSLNKILCGFSPMEDSSPGKIEITTENTQLVKNLIRAVNGYWPEIGSQSIDSFRANWLIRNGILTEYQNHWELQIEKRAYDSLIQYSPFSFSIIYHLWMEKPLRVTWPY